MPENNAGAVLRRGATGTEAGTVADPLVVSGSVTSTPGGALVAGEGHIGQVGGEATVAAATQFARPTDTTAYASGDLVANTTVANTVTPLTFTVARIPAGSGMIRRAKIKKSGTSVTNAQFRLHLYSAAPVQTGAGGAGTGDNAAFSTDGAANYLGALDVTVDRAFTDGAVGTGLPVVGSEITFKLASGTTIRGLLEARAAYTPGNAETFDISLEVLQN